MTAAPASRPRLLVVAGPNGAGKTTITERGLAHEWFHGCEYVASSRTGPRRGIVNRRRRATLASQGPGRIPTATDVEIAIVPSADLAPFTPLVPRAGLSLELVGPHPTLASTWCDSALQLPASGTHFAYAINGTAVLRSAARSYTLQSGMYAAFIEGELRGSGTGLVVTRLGVFGMFQLGGPIEARGRLNYIDGCSDSLLLGPPRLGDPCLNHLHIPRATRQTQHHHPSLRVGVIARGSGRCVTARGEHRLEPGLGFVIASDALHSFFTDDESLDVVVYHPESDTGPTDDDHPMINRTIIAGG